MRQDPQFEGSDKTIFWVKPSYYRRMAMTDAKDNDTSVKKAACGDSGEGEIPMESARNRPLEENTLIVFYNDFFKIHHIYLT